MFVKCEMGVCDKGYVNLDKVKTIEPRYNTLGEVVSYILCTDENKEYWSDDERLKRYLEEAIV